jgi:hypothetical protein
VKVLPYQASEIWVYIVCSIVFLTITESMVGYNYYISNAKNIIYSIIH